MENLEKYYASASLMQLKKLTNELDELEISSIPYLQKELIKRGELYLALSITEKLASNNKVNNQNLYSIEEIKEYVQELIREGYTLDQIKENLISNGVDIDKYTALFDFQEHVKLNSYLHLKSEGLSDEEIIEKMKEVDENEIVAFEKTKDEILSKAHSKINWGILIIMLSVFIFIATLFSERLGFVAIPISKFLFGLYLYNDGKETLRNLGEN